MNEFKFSCPHCQQNIEATPEYVGVQLNCPSCQTPIVVPDVKTATAAMRPGKLTMAPSTVQHAATSKVMATTMVRKTKKPRVGLYVGLGVGAVAVVAAIIFVPKAIDKYHEHQATVAAEEEAKKAPPPPPPDLEADEILKKIGATYKGVTSYGAQGESVATVDMSQVNPSNPAFKEPQQTTVKFSILLGRPDLYRMEWEKQVGLKSIKGDAWSSGKGDYVRQGTTATKMKNRQLALSTAAGSSGTLGVFLAGLFYDESNSLAVALKNFSKTNNETLNGRKCYVLTGKAASQNLMLWIHKDDFLIAKAEALLGGKMDDSVLATLTPAQKAQMQMMSKIKGNIIETYDNIETNKVLNADAFQTAFTPNSFTPNTNPPRNNRAGGPGQPGRGVRGERQ